MSQITYDPRIPTSRKVVPSQYQRLRASRWIILTMGVDTSEFMEALELAANSMALVMKRMADA